MSKTSTVGQRIVGSVAGLSVGGVALGLLGVLIAMQLAPDSHGDPDSRAGQEALFIFVCLVGPGLLIGGTTGAAGGATIVQRLLGQRSSFWKALLGAVVGLLIGIPIVLTVYGIPLVPIAIIAGAVVGSDGKDEPVALSGMQGAISPSDILKPQPGQPKCPFCQSTSFHVEEAAGFRRCSECHSVLPSYILGNR